MICPSCKGYGCGPLDGRDDSCATCKGTGKVHECGACNGTGAVQSQIPVFGEAPLETNYVICIMCSGTGNHVP